MSKNRKKRLIERIDLSKYDKNPLFGHKFTLRRVEKHIDYKEPVKLDSARLMAVFDLVHRRDWKVYLYFLEMLERNDIPIHGELKKIRQYVETLHFQNVYNSIVKLCAIGVLIKTEGTSNTYYVNPAYAWKGNRADYIVLDENSVSDGSEPEFIPDFGSE